MPSTAGQEQMVSVTFQLPRELRERLEAIAREEERSLAWLLRQAARAYADAAAERAA